MSKLREAWGETDHHIWADKIRAMNMDAAITEAEAEIERLTRERDAALAKVERMDEALVLAEQFITNGVDLGYIRMPDIGTPDPAHLTLPAIRAARAARKEPTDENP